MIPESGGKAAKAWRFRGFGDKRAAISSLNPDLPSARQNGGLRSEQHYSLSRNWTVMFG